jgi:hypothetical protein
MRGFSNFRNLDIALKADQKRTEETRTCADLLKAKWLDADSSGSAKPLYVGSNPTRASKPVHKSYLG